jgi:SAM-dependent methyltransferase
MALTSEDLSGSWKKEMYADHLPDATAFDAGFIQSVVDICQPTTVLDLGCGQGYFVKWLREKGIEAWGVEGEELDTLFKAPGYQIQQDLSNLFDLGKTYDVVMCTEVVEHIPEAFEEVVFNNIAHHTHRHLVFSGATPGQGGTGHVNEKPEVHWFSCLVSRGFKLLHEASTQIRLASTLDWYVKNLSIWELQPGQEHSLEEAKAIAERDSYILSRAVSDQKLIREQHQVADLTFQLHQTKTELHDSETQLHQAQIELHEAKTQLHEAKTQLHEAKTQLYEAKIEGHEVKTQLHQAQVEQHHIKELLSVTESDLESARTQIWEFQTKTEILNFRLTRIRAKRQELRAALDEAQNEVNIMKTSRFWSLRDKWFKLKSLLGLADKD